MASNGFVEFNLESFKKHSEDKDGGLDWRSVFAYIERREFSLNPHRPEDVEIIARDLLQAFLDEGCDDDDVTARIFDFYCRYLDVVGRRNGPVDGDFFPRGTDLFSSFTRGNLWNPRPVPRRLVTWILKPLNLHYKFLSEYRSSAMKSLHLLSSVDTDWTRSLRMASLERLEWTALNAGDSRFFTAILRYGIWKGQMDREECYWRSDFFELWMYIRIHMYDRDRRAEVDDLLDQQIEDDDDPDQQIEEDYESDQQNEEDYESDQQNEDDDDPNEENEPEDDSDQQIDEDEASDQQNEDDDDPSERNEPEDDSDQQAEEKNDAHQQIEDDDSIQSNEEDDDLYDLIGENNPDQQIEDEDPIQPNEEDNVDDDLDIVIDENNAILQLPPEVLNLLDYCKGHVMWLKFRKYCGQMFGENSKGSLRRIAHIVRTLKAVVLHREDNPGAEEYVKCLKLYFASLPDPMVSAEEVMEFLLYVVRDQQHRHVVDWMFDKWIQLFGWQTRRPRSLTHLCCCAVRDVVLEVDDDCQTLPNLLKRLHIPDRFKEYLLFLDSAESIPS